MTDSVQVLKPGVRMTDATGAVLSGAILYFYEAGTSNARTVYSDRSLANSLGVSVTCDSGGYPSSDGSTKCEVYTGTGAYRAKLVDSQANTIWDQDQIVGALDTSPFTAASFAKPDTDCASDTVDTTLTTDELGTVRNGNPTGGTFTYTLPSAITVGNGKGYGIRHVGTANQINIAGVLGQTIDGLTTYAIKGQHESAELVSDGANWHIKTDANRTIYAGTVLPEGYLTLTSGTPIITGDVAAATAVYYTPYSGNLIPIYDGTRWVLYEFSELTLSLASQHVASTIYDVFVFLNSGVVTIGTGPAWSTSTAGSGARGSGAGTTELARTKGLLLNAVQITARNGSSTYTVAASRATYVGSLFIDGSNGQITCHRTFGQSRKWGVWNAYNRQLIVLKVGDSTANWTYSSATIRQSRATAGNTGAAFCGLAEEWVNVEFSQVNFTNISATASGGGISYVGLNSTTAAVGTWGYSNQTAGAGSSMLMYHMPVARYDHVPGLGVNNLNCLESCQNTVTITFHGTEALMCMNISWLG